MTQVNWEEQVLKGVQAFKERFDEELKKAGFTIPEDLLNSDSSEPESPEDDVASTVPAHEAVRLLRLAEEAVKRNDNDAAAGYLAIVDRYNDLV